MAKSNPVLESEAGSRLIPMQEMANNIMSISQ
ncbi:hypothetical protein WP2S18C03_08700 [Aeromonas veronii]|nr:hypothetical protein WP2S18C03_08700 [Aeromonas veronii]